jgi:elongator complex protein 3
METRPDWARAPQVDRMIKLGATLVEVGVQAIDDELLKGVNRGSSVKDAAEATRTLRDCGLKVGYHMMPGLPGSSKVKDIESMRRIFEDEDFKPDYFKIYPTLVIEGTGLSEMWRDGVYRALSNEDAMDIIIEAAKRFPKWVRVSRIQRDIPANIILDGVKKSNLRELVEAGIKSRGMKCRCIRCREVGLAKIRGWKTTDLKPELTVETYEAGGGTEEFISAEDPQKDLLIGFIRLRVPSEKAHRPEVKGAGVIRELHVYGQQVAIGESAKIGYQHQGWGSTLLQKAEKLTSEKHGLRRIVVLPGVGVRGYYRQRGYRKWKSSPFMAKDL